MKPSCLNVFPVGNPAGNVEIEDIEDEVLKLTMIYYCIFSYIKNESFNLILPFSMISASDVNLSSCTPLNDSKSKKKVDYKTSLLNARDFFVKGLLIPHIKMIQTKFTQPIIDEKEPFYYINVTTSSNDVIGKFEDTSFTKSKFLQNMKFAFSKYLAKELETMTKLKLWVTIKKNPLEEYKYSVYLKLKRKFVISSTSFNSIKK